MFENAGGNYSNSQKLAAVIVGIHEGSGLHVAKITRLIDYYRPRLLLGVSKGSFIMTIT